MIYIRLERGQWQLFYRKKYKLFYKNIKKSSLMTADQASRALHSYASPQKALILKSFFKTGPGEYGEGDIFIGVKVPETRKIALSFQALSIPEILKLLHSRIHEERLLAILILIRQYKYGSLPDQKRIISLYLNNTQFINNWDLIDLSAPHLLGDNLKDRPRKILYQLAGSISLWERRIAIVSTFAFIRLGEFKDTLQLTDLLITDEEDLIHKACGWMLREVGKRNIATLKSFLIHRHSRMPRTMLRYAIEKFPETERSAFLKKKT